MAPLWRSLRRIGGRLLPETLEAELDLRRERALFEAHLRDAWGIRPRRLPLGPAPDGRIASVTWGDFDHTARRVDRLRFFWLGHRLARQCCEALWDAGFDLPGARSLLEIGCGTGRLLRLFRAIDGLRLVGTDIDAESIAWCRAAVPVAEYHVNTPEPRLDFAHDGEFGLVLAAAVFMAMRAESQREWLREVRRVVRPGGIFLCTMLNETAQRIYLTQAERERLRRDGELVFEASHPRASATAKLTGQRDVYHPPERTAALFGERFEVVARRPLGGGQDLWVLRRPTGPG